MYPAWYHYSIDPLKAPGPPPDQAGEPQQSKLGQPTPGTSSNLTPAQAKLILGGEAAMWEELASPENLDAKLWPRLAAIAERFWSPESITDTQSMYRRLYTVNHWLEWLDLTQRSNLERMRQRLADPLPSQPLDVVASILEPVKGYSRHAENYTIMTPLNTLVDSIPPESNAAREFSEDVTAFLAAGSHTASSAEPLRSELESWRASAEKTLSISESSAILYKDRPAIQAVQMLSQSALGALSYLDGTATPSSGWKRTTESAIDPYIYQRVGDLVIPIAPPIRKLIDAVSDSTAAARP